MHTFNLTISQHQLSNVHKVVDSHIKALKNWIASRVESGDLEGAQKLTAELREYEALFAASNVEAHPCQGRRVMAELSENQALYLRYLRNKGAKEGRPHGLIQKGFIRYIWSNDPSFGYKLTAAGRKALKAWEEEHK